MRFLQYLRLLLAVAVVAGLATAGYITRDHWLSWLRHEASDITAGSPAAGSPAEGADAAAPTGKVLLSDQAIANLGLSATPAYPRTYWKTIQVPGMVVDRPGQSDRGVVSPVTGVVASVNYFPGETVRPGDVLFTIQLLSESLHQTQSELFKATQDIKLAQARRQRLEAARAGVPEARIIEADNDIIRLEVAVKAYRRELVNRGLTPDQIDQAAEGNFVRETAIVVPSPPAGVPSAPPLVQQAAYRTTAPAFEVQELKVEVGHQVQAGQTLCLLANHQVLAIEGQAFRDETLLLERSVIEGWPVEVDFQENPQAGWGEVDQVFHIRHMANTIDLVRRTFAFRMPLENQSRVIEQEGRTQILWRFRPGQKVRLSIRVEKFDNVFVLPSEAVAWEGPEAFVFTQNVNTFERKPVRVLSQDRRHTVLPNDGSLLPNSFVVQNAAAQLDRMVNAGTDNDMPEGYHIHADGSLHKNEDEGK